MANLQHYIHYKLQNEQEMLRRSNEGSRAEREGGILHMHFLWYRQSGVITVSMWWMKSWCEIWFEMLKGNIQVCMHETHAKHTANEATLAYIFECTWRQHLTMQGLKTKRKKNRNGPANGELRRETQPHRGVPGRKGPACPTIRGAEK